MPLTHYSLECLRGDVVWGLPGGFFVSIFYNRTGAFLVSGIYLIGYDREFVILLVNLLVRLTVFRCFSVFHPLRLVLFHTVNVSVFCRVLFWHCFCSPCCDLCAATWVTVLYTVFVGVFFWYRTVTQVAAQRSHHSEQKQCQWIYVEN